MAMDGASVVVHTSTTAITITIATSDHGVVGDCASIVLVAPMAAVVVRSSGLIRQRIEVEIQSWVLGGTHAPLPHMATAATARWSTMAMSSGRLWARGTVCTPLATVLFDLH